MAALNPVFYSLVLTSLWLSSASVNVLAAQVPDLSGPALAPDSVGIASVALTDKMSGVDARLKVDTQRMGDRRYEHRLALKPSAVPNISERQATQIALKAVPGEVTDVGIETKKGKKVYVIEIIAKKGGKETDVFVDMETGEVLGTD